MKILPRLTVLVVALGLGTIAAQASLQETSWWASREEPELTVRGLPLVPPLAPGARIPAGATLGNPELLDIQIGAPFHRQLTGYEALAFLSVRDYLVFDKERGRFVTTRKFAEIAMALPIEPGEYSYGGGTGTVSVVRTGQNQLRITLTWNRPGNPDKYEISNITEVQTGRAVGQCRCTSCAPADPRATAWTVEILRVQLPGAARIRFVTPQGDGGSNMNGLEATKR